MSNVEIRFEWTEEKLPEWLFDFLMHDNRVYDVGVGAPGGFRSYYLREWQEGEVKFNER